MVSLLDRALTPLGRALRHRRSGLTVLSRPGWDVDRRLSVTSTSFPAEGRIPDVHSSLGRGRNVSPQLAWDGVPEGTRQLLFVMEDLDLPSRRPGLHCLGLLAPDVRALPEGAMTRDNPDIRWIATHGGLHRGYSGPRPLPGHGRHRYEFHVFALDRPIPATPRSVDQLGPWVAGHVLARGTVSGHQDG